MFYTCIAVLLHCCIAADRERESVRGAIEGELAVEMDSLRSQCIDMESRYRSELLRSEALDAENKRLQALVDALQEKVTDAEVNQEYTDQEVQRLSAENEQLEAMSERVEEQEKVIAQIRSQLVEEKSQRQQMVDVYGSEKQLFQSKTEKEKYEVCIIIRNVTLIILQYSSIMTCIPTASLI